MYIPWSFSVVKNLNFFLVIPLPAPPPAPPIIKEHMLMIEDSEKAEKQTARLQRIAEEAAKQCGRAKIPTVVQPMSYSAMLDEAKGCSAALFCYENEGGLTVKNLLKEMNKPDSIAIIVGAEGGFSPEEAEEAKARGCLSVSLGNRILRCETAPLFALTAISYEYEL